MLVLSRKVGEEIIIGDNIRVRVLSIHGNQIRLGFVAPRDVSIQREELLQQATTAVALASQKKVAPTRRNGDEALPKPDAVVEVIPNTDGASI